MQGGPFTEQLLKLTLFYRANSEFLTMLRDVAIIRPGDTNLAVILRM
jgi:hypothetical protein